MHVNCIKSEIFTYIFHLSQQIDGEIKRLIATYTSFFLSAFTQNLQISEQSVLDLPPHLPQKDETTLEVSVSGAQKTLSQYLSFCTTAVFTIEGFHIQFFVNKMW